MTDNQIDLVSHGFSAVTSGTMKLSDWIEEKRSGPDWWVERQFREFSPFTEHMETGGGNGKWIGECWHIVDAMGMDAVVMELRRMSM